MRYRPRLASRQDEITSSMWDKYFAVNWLATVPGCLLVEWDLCDPWKASSVWSITSSRETVEMVASCDPYLCVLMLLTVLKHMILLNLILALMLTFTVVT